MIRAAFVAALLATATPHHHHRARHPRTLFPSLHIHVPAGQPPVTPPTQTDTTPAPPPPPPPVVYPSRTGVDEGEYYVHLAHMTLAAGPVELNLTNFGMDD